METPEVILDLVRLPPGAYTVTVTGAAATTGTALVEIYDLP